MTIAIGESLLTQGLIDAATLETARGQSGAADGPPLAKHLVAMGAVTEAQVMTMVAQQLGVPFADTTVGAVDPEAAALVPKTVAAELFALPVAFGQGGDVLVAVADPNNTAALERVTAMTGLPAVLALAVRADLQAAIDRLADTAQPAQAAPAAPPGGKPELLAFEQEQAVDLDAVLAGLLEHGGSDLHLTAGVAPTIRVKGELQPLDGYPVMTPDELQKMLYGILTQKQRERFENDLELDISYAVPKVARFRVNVFQQRDSIGAVMRVIPFDILSIEELGIPAQVVNFAHLPRGFVLVTGPTGSGKSTTLAALIDVINRERASHIMTIEDPIEFLHAHKRSVVNQRELGTDTLSFAQALKHVLRQDPDVILVGEMRDLETIQVALTAAETGHLVFGTLHTQDAPQTVDRVIDVFPPEQQEQIRVMLGGALQGVMCQQLVKTADGEGRVAACEVMVATPAIRNLIREGKTHQMYSSIQAGKAHGMITMDQSLANLVIAGTVTHSAALEKCNNVPDFNRLCGKA
ncbi:MAG: PilT/PilU family type 4a pilus ATPase [Egibacteraceae bacterium]